MANFALFIPKLLKREGGYVNDPQDRGGETYRGIARKSNPSWSGWSIIDAKKKQSEIKKGTIFPELENNVIAFYKKNYWDKVSGDKIANQAIAENIADWFVNGSFSWKKIQRAINNLGQNIEVDGIVGPQTLNALNKVDQIKLFDAILELRRDLYTEIVQKDATQQRFYQGWLNRLAELDRPVLVTAGFSALGLFVGLGLLYLIVKNN